MKKELILNVDDLGLHIDTVLAVQELWENKRISTVSLLSTSSILDATIDKLKKIGIPVGVHLILDGDRPILEKNKIPSLIDEQGFMLNDYNAIRKRVKPDEVFNEFSAQIENIQKRGVSVSHLDSHRGFCFLIPKLRKVYRELGEKYNLPLALPDNFIFNKTRRLVPGSTDSLNGIYDLEEETFENRIKAYDLMLSRLGYGKHYCFSHPSPPTKSIMENLPDFKIRNNDYALFLSDEWSNLLKKYNITLSSF
ncbi:MAG TPA: ChbG/HpnK family deacetylase [Spirochaetota bacterium]|nr:ChbG/HpnK family deacetylase [Spirochaetota bacterium]